MRIGTLGVVGVLLGSLRNDDGDSYESVTFKKSEFALPQTLPRVFHLV